MAVQYHQLLFYLVATFSFAATSSFVLAQDVTKHTTGQAMSLASGQAFVASFFGAGHLSRSLKLPTALFRLRSLVAHGMPAVLAAEAMDLTSSPTQKLQSQSAERRGPGGNRRSRQQSRRRRRSGSGGKYMTAAGPVEGKLNVHLVPHSHDDVGWLKTLDQYYIGSNNSIQVAGVQYILDSVVAELWAHPDRKFIQVEMAFFQRWWREQSKETRRRVKCLIRDGQFEFINGGWAMHDEAATLYIDMIDQMSLGHRFLLREFGVTPRVAWQIDPFGHSAVQAYLITAQAGFDGVFFARADYADTEKRYAEKSSEFVWRSSKSFGSEAEVFGCRMHIHYLPPPSFRYDTMNTDPPVQDDPCLADMNVEERVETFVATALDQATKYRTNHIMWSMGDDFAYGNANTWFKNMDKLIHYVNKDGRINAFYSTPSIYLDAKHAANITWPLKKGDFFPYADCPHCYWTGYFSSRPALKGFVRHCSALLMASRQLEFFVGRASAYAAPDADAASDAAIADAADAADRSRRPQANAGAGCLKPSHGTPGWCQVKLDGAADVATTDSLEEAVAVSQHHDAVSGTAQQHVTNDYAKRLERGAAEARQVLLSGLEKLLRGGDGKAREKQTEEGTRGGIDNVDGIYDGRDVEGGDGEEVNREKQIPTWELGPLGLQMCPLLNVSICQPSLSDFHRGNTLIVVAYNPLGWQRTEFLRFPISFADVIVTDAEGNAVEAQVMPLTAARGWRSKTSSSRRRRRTGMKQQEEMGGRQLEGEGDGAHEAEENTAFNLFFQAQLPPLGYRTFFVTGGSPGGEERRAFIAQEAQFSRHGDVITMGSFSSENKPGSSEGIDKDGHPDPVLLSIDSATAQMRAVASNVAISEDYFWYAAFNGSKQEDGSSQPAGAYIMRPKASEANRVTSSSPPPRLLRGPLVEEVHRQVSPWLSHVVRTFRGEPHVELQYTVGPVPIDDGEGKEVILRFETGIDSKNQFFTDSNGRDYLKRTINHRDDWTLNVTEPVAGNYYPLNAGLFITNSSLHFSLLVDRPMGGSSLRGGEVEVMIHRRLLHDDWRGVAEPLNETECSEGQLRGEDGEEGEKGVQTECHGLVVTGTLLLSVLPPSAAVSWRRLTAQRILLPPQLAFGILEPSSPPINEPLPSSLSSFSASNGYELPPNIAIITLQERDDASVLIRLAHLFEADEHEELSTLAVVDLQLLLGSRKILNVEEMSLTANRKRSEMKKPLKWKLDEQDLEVEEDKPILGKPLQKGKHIVELGPMEIRTFLLWFKSLDS